MTIYYGIVPFLKESLAIESIHRAPTPEEVRATETFLATGLSVASICVVQEVYAPNRPLRKSPGMNVRVGDYYPPTGGRKIVNLLRDLVADIDGGGDPFRCHVRFESLHPFMDGNGRTGRILWAWNMQRKGLDPFSLPFLHRFYYQTLAASSKRTDS